MPALLHVSELNQFPALDRTLKIKLVLPQGIEPRPFPYDGIEKVAERILSRITSFNVLSFTPRQHNWTQNAAYTIVTGYPG